MKAAAAGVECIFTSIPTNDGHTIPDWGSSDLPGTGGTIGGSFSFDPTPTTPATEEDESPEGTCPTHQSMNIVFDSEICACITYDDPKC